MPIIAQHHRPGHWRHLMAGDDQPFVPACDWPDDCLVQWGKSGLVMTGTKAYTTAFFEAFPSVPATFIRGEGASVALAEQAAFAKFERHRACIGHEWERGRYRNGGALCKHCGLFGSDVFEPLERCTVCNVPTFHSMGYGPADAEGKKTEHWYCEAHVEVRKANGHSNLFDWVEAEDAKRDLVKEEADTDAFLARLAQMEEDLKRRDAEDAAADVSTNSRS